MSDILDDLVKAGLLSERMYSSEQISHEDAKIDKAAPQAIPEKFQTDAGAPAAVPQEPQQEPENKEEPKQESSGPTALCEQYCESVISLVETTSRMISGLSLQEEKVTAVQTASSALKEAYANLWKKTEAGEVTMHEPTVDPIPEPSVQVQVKEPVSVPVSAPAAQSPANQPV